MADLPQQLAFIRAGMETTRFHCVRRITPETVGHHSLGVAWFCYLLSDGKPSAELLIAAMSHDLAESIVGDVPSPTKRQFMAGLDDHEKQLATEAGLPPCTLTLQEEYILGLADCLDGLISCLLEINMGNKGLQPIADKYHEYLKTQLSSVIAEPLHVRLFNIVLEEYNYVG